MANKYRSAHDRFEDNIERTDSCWLWTGEAVTHQENMRRAALAAGKDVACSNGHPRTSENVRVTRLGHQRCRACNRLHAQTPEQRAKRNARDRARRAQRAPAATLSATHADQDAESAPAPVRDAEGPQNAVQGREGER